MFHRFFTAILFLPLALQNPNSMTPEERAKMEAQNAGLHAMLQAV